MVNVRPAMATATLRGLVSWLAATWTSMSLAPVPDLVWTTAHAAGELAVQAHPVSVDTRVPVVPAVAGMVTSMGFREKVQGAAACVTATWDPLTAILPLRARPWGFAVAVRVIAASPWPEVGEI
jgi:hypothetical protein